MNFSISLYDLSPAAVRYQYSTPADLAEKIAEWVGVTNKHRDEICFDLYSKCKQQSSELILCRSCFIKEIARQIEESVANKRFIEVMEKTK